MAAENLELPLDLDVKEDVVFNASNPLLMRQLSSCVGAGTLMEKMERWYLFVRDAIRYDAGMMDVSEVANSASRTLENQKGHGVQKSILFATGLRAMGVPARLGLARVQNHLSSQASNMPSSSHGFTPHGYAAYWQGERWIKCTPVFNRSLCKRLGTLPLEWTPGKNSLHQPLDKSGERVMEITEDYGMFTQMPMGLIQDELERAAPFGYRNE